MQQNTKQPKVVIYTTDTCPYCVRAKLLLKRKGVEFQEIKVNDLIRQDLVEKTGRKTVPQIFIADKHIGGCDDLYELEEKGKLDRILFI